MLGAQILIDLSPPPIEHHRSNRRSFQGYQPPLSFFLYPISIRRCWLYFQNQDFHLGFFKSIESQFQANQKFRFSTASPISSFDLISMKKHWVYSSDILGSARTSFRGVEVADMTRENPNVAASGFGSDKVSTVSLNSEQNL